MKEIKAFIRPHKLSDVTLALHGVEGMVGMTVSECKGFGHRKSKNKGHRIVEELIDYYPQMKIEVLCRDDLADKLVSVIQQSAHTGVLGDGIIYVTDIDKAVRISTCGTGDGIL